MSSTIDSDTPPRFYGNGDYASWKIRFEAFILDNDSDLWSYFTNEYFWPRQDGTFLLDSPLKTLSKMTEEEKKEHEKDRKAHAVLTKCLPSYVMVYFRSCNTAFELWDALKVKFGKNCPSEASEEENHLEGTSNRSATVKVKLDSCLFNPNCSKCFVSQETVDLYRKTNADLMQKVDDLKTANRKYKENETISKAKIDAQLTEIGNLKAKISCQQVSIESHLTEISLLSKEKADAEQEVLKFKKLESSMATQKLVIDEMIFKRNSKDKTGIGFAEVPPPTSYALMPELVLNPVLVSNPIKISEPPKVHVEDKKDKGKEKISVNSTVIDKDSTSFTGSVRKPPEIRVTTSQPSAEKEKVKKVCCFYCKTPGHLVKECALLAKQRLKRKELIQKQQAKPKINNASVKSSGKYLPPHARERSIIRTTVPPKQVWRVKSLNADIPEKNTWKKPASLSMESRCSSFKKNLKAKAKGELSQGELSNNVALKLLGKLLCDFQQIVEANVKKDSRRPLRSVSVRA